MGKKACGVLLSGDAHGRMERRCPRTRGWYRGHLCTMSQVLGPARRISHLEIVITWWIGLETHSSEH